MTEHNVGHELAITTTGSRDNSGKFRGVGKTAAESFVGAEFRLGDVQHVRIIVELGLSEGGQIGELLFTDRNLAEHDLRDQQSRFGRGGRALDQLLLIDSRISLRRKFHLRFRSKGLA